MKAIKELNKFLKRKNTKVVVRQIGDEKGQVDGTLFYRDIFVSAFIDTDKCLLVLVNRQGNTKVRDIDSNYYCIEDDIADYYELLTNMTSNEKEVKEYLDTFIKHISKGVDNFELNKEYLKTRGLTLWIILDMR